MQRQACGVPVPSVVVIWRIQDLIPRIYVQTK